MDLPISKHSQKSEIKGFPSFSAFAALSYQILLTALGSDRVFLMITRSDTFLKDVMIRPGSVCIPDSSFSLAADTAISLCFSRLSLLSSS